MVPVRLRKLARACVVGVVLVSCGIEELEPRGLEQPLGMPPAELRDVVFEGFGSAGRDAEVRAARARFDSQRGMLELDDVDIDFAEETRGRMQIWAPGASMDLESQDFRLLGGVRGTTEAGDRFATQDLAYDRARELLSSESPVRLDRSGMTLEADGMELELGERRVRLTGKVQALFDGNEPTLDPGAP